MQIFIYNYCVENMLLHFYIECLGSIKLTKKIHFQFQEQVLITERALLALRKVCWFFRNNILFAILFETHQIIIKISKLLSYAHESIFYTHASNKFIKFFP